MSLVSPARVGHAITHSSAAGTLGGTALGVGVGVVVAILAWPATATASAVALGAALLTAAGTVSTFGSAGGIAADIMGVNKLFDASVDGHLLTGFPTVKLGPEIKNAARADPDTSADCSGEHAGWEGAEHVFLGNKPMSRVGDRLKCQGKIMEGEKNIYVGGNPSQQGKELKEAQRDSVYWTSIGLDILGIAGSKKLYELGLNVGSLAMDAAAPDTTGTSIYNGVAGAIPMADDITGLSQYGVKSTLAGAAMYGSVLFH